MSVAHLPDGPRAPVTVLDAARHLRADVAALTFPLDLPTTDAARAGRAELLDQLDHHLVPRLRAASAPAVVVVAGSTGAGKSTLVNTMLGEEVSPAGVLRPTTRLPVLVHHPADAALFADHPLREVVEVIAREAAPRGLGLVDAPDLDSVETANRALAHRLLAAADLWLFTTTATRYGDALPWQVLAEAVERAVALAVVLNRVPDDAVTEVRRDLMDRMRERGLAAAPLFVVRDAGPIEGLLDASATAPIRRWLMTMAGADRARSVIARSQRGALAAVAGSVRPLTEEVAAQASAARALTRVVDRAVDSATSAAEVRVTGGVVADGAVRGRWAQAVAAGVSEKPARRGRIEREKALDLVRADLLAAATVAFEQAREAGERVLVAALRGSGLPGADGLVAALAPGVGEGARTGEPPVPTPGAPTPPAPAPEASAGYWLHGAERVFRLLTDGPSARPAAQLRDRLGTEGAATVVAAAAAGLGVAGALLTRAVGRQAAHEVVTAGAAELARRAGEQAGAAGRSARAILAAVPQVDLPARLADLEAR